jgi:methylmalonyl-CoA mutase N-terminal domain/subunit
LAKIEAIGGAVRAFEEGYFQKEIARSAYEYQRRVESGEQLSIGINAFVEDEPDKEPAFELDDEEEGRQCERLHRIKAERDANEVTSCLRELQEAARGTENLMPPIIRAIQAYASLGEMTAALACVFGRYRENRYA